MAIEIIGIVLVATHILAIALIILWFGLGIPKSMAQFRVVFKKQVLGIKNRGPQLHPKR